MAKPSRPIICLPACLGRLPWDVPSPLKRNMLHGLDSFSQAAFRWVCSNMEPSQEWDLSVCFDREARGSEEEEEREFRAHVKDIIMFDHKIRVYDRRKNKFKQAMRN